MTTEFPQDPRPSSVEARERLMNDLKAVARDAEDLVRSAAGDASIKAKEAGMKLTETLERAKLTCQNLQDRSAASATAVAGDVDEAVRAHPYKSMGIVLAIGVLFGALLKKR